MKQCITDNCLYEFILRKIGDQTFSFYWKYTGSKELMGSLKIKSIVVAAPGKKWKTEELLTISSAEGTLPFEAPLIH